MQMESLLRNRGPLRKATAGLYSIYWVELLKCQSRQLMHCDTLKQDNDSTVRGDGGSRVGEVRAGTTSPMPEHKGFKLQ